MPALYVVDTDVVVSGVLRFGQGAAPAVLLDRMLTGRFAFLVSASLLAEYRQVLLRPSIATSHGLPDSAVDRLLAALTMAGYLRQPDDHVGSDDDPAPVCPPGDEHVVRLLAREPVSVLVSGDRRLLDAVRGWRDVLTPAEAVERAGLVGPRGES